VSIARASAEQAYLEADRYQRTAILVEPEPGLSYAVDVFAVTGEGIVTSDLLIQTPKNVIDIGGLVETRDAMGPGWQTARRYQTSGSAATITADVDEGRSVRFHLLSELDEVVVGKRPHPYPIPDTYPTDRETISLRRRGEGSFMSVVEPFVDHPAIGRASRIDVDKGTVGIKVERRSGREMLFLADGEQAAVDIPDAQVSFRGQFGAISTDQGGRLAFMQLVNGDLLQTGGYAIRNCSAITGQVTDWDAKQRTLTVQTEAALQSGEWYAGETVLVGRGECTSSFTIKRVAHLGDQQYLLCLADTAELEIYHSRVHRVSANGWVTGYSSMPRVYKAIGAWLLNPRHPDPKATACRIAQVDPWNTFIVEDKPKLIQSFHKDDPLVIAVVSVGDAFTIPSRFYLEQVGSDRYEVETNCPAATLTLPRPETPASRLVIEQTEDGGRDEEPITKDHVTVRFRQREAQRGRYALHFAK